MLRAGPAKRSLRRSCRPEKILFTAGVEQLLESKDRIGEGRRVRNETSFSLRGCKRGKILAVKAMR